MDLALYCPTQMVAEIHELVLKHDLDNGERQGMNRKPYRALIGSLLYLSCHTRPDTSFAIDVLARLVENPTRIHWKAGERIQHYLLGDSDADVIIGSRNPRIGADLKDGSSSTAYCDSEQAGEVSDRKSVCAFIVLLNGGIVTWKTNKQNCTTVSSTEAEYVALSECVRKLRHLRKVGQNVEIHERPSTVFEDKKECTKGAEERGT